MNQHSSNKKSYKPTVKFATNEENGDKPNASVEIKRTDLIESNCDNKQKELKSNSKCVLFDSNTLSTKSAKLNTTIIVHKNESLISIENKSHSKVRNLSPNKQLSFNYQLNNENKKDQRVNKNTENIDKHIANKEHLTFHQKRKLAQEKKAKFDQTLAIVRRKILTRKFAYIWLRIFYYKTKHTKKPIPSVAR